MLEGGGFAIKAGLLQKNKFLRQAHPWEGNRRCFCWANTWVCLYGVW